MQLQPGFAVELARDAPHAGVSVDPSAKACSAPLAFESFGGVVGADFRTLNEGGLPAGSSSRNARVMTSTCSIEIDPAANAVPNGGTASAVDARFNVLAAAPWRVHDALARSRSGNTEMRCKCCAITSERASSQGAHLPD